MLNISSATPEPRQLCPADLILSLTPWHNASLSAPNTQHEKSQWDHDQDVLYTWVENLL